MDQTQANHRAGGARPPDAAGGAPGGVLRARACRTGRHGAGAAPARRKAGALAAACLSALALLSAEARGAEIEVGDFASLRDALGSAGPGDAILLRDGVYQIGGQFALVPGSDHLTIRSQSGNRDAVIVRGQGYHGGVNHGFFVSRDHVTIQDITVQDVANHCIQLDVNVDHFHLKNCVLRDGYEQLLKVPYSEDVADPSESGLVEGCLFAYTAGQAPNWYTGGVDVHFGRGWIVRDSTFLDIQSPGGHLAEHAIHFWTRSEGTLVERNRIINCDRGIGFGLGASPHFGGVIRNNMITHDGSGAFADVGIGLESSSGSQVVHNTIFLGHERYGNAIEYRFAETCGVLIANNLANQAVASRDGGEATAEANITCAQAGWFADPSAGDLHLASALPWVVDRGVAVPGMTDDFDGQGRPRGSGLDVGADEVGAPPPLHPAVLLLLQGGGDEP